MEWLGIICMTSILVGICALLCASHLPQHRAACVPHWMPCHRHWSLAWTLGKRPARPLNLSRRPDQWATCSSLRWRSASRPWRST